VKRLALALTVFAGACAAAGGAAPIAPPPAIREPAPASLPAPSPPAAMAAPEAAAPASVVVATCEARRGRDGLRRAAVLRALDGGLGNWLRNVDIDPKLEHGRFRGWIIRTLPADDACYADLDLRAGDVVTRVNGRPVERPEEASDVWDGLRTSSALVIDFTRAGQPHTLRLKIVEP
jgi:hypothetical protein